MVVHVGVSARRRLRTVGRARRGWRDAWWCRAGRRAGLVNATEAEKHLRAVLALVTAVMTSSWRRQWGSQ
jgi:hypothetical protein